MTSGELGGFEPHRNLFAPTKEYVSKVAIELQQYHDATTNQIIAQGYRDLFKNVFTKYSDLGAEVTSHVTAPEELGRTKKEVSTMFLQLSEPSREYRWYLGTRYEHWTPTLNPKQIFVLINRFGLIDGEKKTYKQIGEAIKLSPERIRQIEARAFRKILKPIYKNLTLHVFEVKWKQGIPRFLQ